MKKTIYLPWLKHWNGLIATQTPNRKIVYVHDNFSGHGSDEDWAGLSNIKVICLPPNATAHVHPMDAGIIAAFKMGYRRQLLRNVLNRFDDGVLSPKQLFNVDILTAMRWCKAIWRNMPTSTIAN
jgi:hypothetical protein